MKRNKRVLAGASLAFSFFMLANNCNVAYAAQQNNIINVNEAFDLDKIQEFNVNEAFDSHLYYARSILTEEGQKAWDFALDTLLKYDNSDNKYPIKDGNSSVTINYKELGISIDKVQASYIQKYLVRQEPRMFHLKDWGATVTADKNGIVETQTFYIGNGAAEGDSYQKALLKAEEEAKQILSNIKDDMTIYQKIQAVQKAYESSVKYVNAGSPGDIRGSLINKQAVCGGYSKGFEYILLRMGIQNIWVNGYAGGAHAWNYVNVNDKWYLMDTTWGGQNWYLRGEVANHQVYDTYHVMPTLEKEGIPYVWGQYPGVWIDTQKNALILLGDDFNPLNYIQDLGDIYGSDLSENITILQNDVDTTKVGNYTVTYQVENKDGNKVQSELTVKVVDGEKLSPNDLNKISGNLVYKPVSLYFNGKEVPYENGLFAGESASIEYNVEDKNIRYFEANVGINKNVRDNTAYGHYGKVQFQVFADNELVYESSILGWKDNYEHMLVEIPENTKKIKLVNVPKGLGNNHGAWGGTTFYSEKTELQIEKRNLEQVIAFADQINDVSYVLVETHKESRLNNLIYIRDEAKKLINSNSSNIEDYKQMNSILIYYIEELGQSYIAGGSPIIKEPEVETELQIEKRNLEQVIAFADQINDVSYVLAGTHKEARLNNLIYIRDEAKKLINSNSSNVEDYKQMNSILIYYIEELGQSYTAGGSPVGGSSKA